MLLLVLPATSKPTSSYAHVAQLADATSLSLVQVSVRIRWWVPHARVVKLADITALEAVGGNSMRVQVPPLAPIKNTRGVILSYFFPFKKQKSHYAFPLFLVKKVLDTPCSEMDLSHQTSNLGFWVRIPTGGPNGELTERYCVALLMRSLGSTRVGSTPTLSAISQGS